MSSAMRGRGRPMCMLGWKVQDVWMKPGQGIYCGGMDIIGPGRTDIRSQRVCVIFPDHRNHVNDRHVAQPQPVLASAGSLRATSITSQTRSADCAPCLHTHSNTLPAALCSLRTLLAALAVLTWLVLPRHMYVCISGASSHPKAICATSQML